MDASSTSSPKPSAVDRAVRDVMSRPLSPEELSGFGPAKRKAPSAWPAVAVWRLYRLFFNWAVPSGEEGD